MTYDHIQYIALDMDCLLLTPKTHQKNVHIKQSEIYLLYCNMANTSWTES